MNYLMIALILFGISFNNLKCQEKQSIFIHGIDTVFSKRMEHIVVEAIHAGDRVVCVTKGNGTVFRLFDLFGNEIFNKRYQSSIKCSISDDGNIIAVGYMYREDGAPYYCVGSNIDIFDSFGNILSTIEKVTTHHIKLSPDGQYLITTTIQGGEDGEDGRFEVFETNAGKKIEWPNFIKYGKFHADFTNQNKIAALFHEIKSTRIKNKNTTLTKNPGRGGRRSRGEKLFDYEHTESFLILDPESKTIEVSKEIVYPETNFFNSSGGRKALWVYPEDKAFLFAGQSKPFEQLRCTQYYCLMLLDRAGSMLWRKSYENDNSFSDHITDLKFIDNSNFLLSKFGLNNSIVYLINAQTGEEIWASSHGGRRSIMFRDYFIDHVTNELIVSVFDRKPLLWRINLSNGHHISEETCVKLFSDSAKHLFLYDKNTSVLTFLKR